MDRSAISDWQTAARLSIIDILAAKSTGAVAGDAESSVVMPTPIPAANALSTFLFHFVNGKRCVNRQRLEMCSFPVHREFNEFVQQVKRSDECDSTKLDEVEFIQL